VRDFTPRAGIAKSHSGRAVRGPEFVAVLL